MKQLFVQMWGAAPDTPKQPRHLVGASSVSPGAEPAFTNTGILSPRFNVQMPNAVRRPVSGSRQVGGRRQKGWEGMREEEQATGEGGRRTHGEKGPRRAGAAGS